MSTIGGQLFSRPWNFVTAAPSESSLPPQTGMEVAFAGRSNVGKSSLINALCNRKGLARTSNVPGRTQALIFFRPEPGPAGTDLTIVDMPGYGFARAPLAEIRNWNRLIENYVRGRAALKRVFVLVDARHGLKRNDLEMLDLLDKAAMSYQIVLTKADKPSASELARRLAEAGQAVSKRPAAHPEIFAVSARANLGIDRLREEIIALVGE